jgi:chromosome segregation ATPase
MCLPKLKRLFLALLLPRLFLPPVFSQEVCLAESEFQELMSIIRTSRANCETQTKLIADLRKTLGEQEAKLRQALGFLEQSETDLTELKASLSKIRSYSDGLNEYCLALEKENAALAGKNRGLKAGLGISSGAAGALAVILLILLL